MASSEEGSKSPAEKKRTAGISRLNSKFSNTWLGRNWQTALIIVLLVFLAFFVRTYFGYSTSVDNGFLVSGGSDSYYHERVIDNVANTGQHLVRDSMLNYPLGVRNERPPLYDWSVAVAGMGLHAFTGMSLTDGLGYALVFSTALWGALTVIPVYLLTKAAFGKKPAIFAGFLFAIMAGAIERSVFSDADHDSMILFFVVFSFYFLLRALQSLKGDKWVTSWRKFGDIKSGLGSFVGMNKAALLYSALAGVCVALIAMIWTGYDYVLIIILAFLAVQLLVDRFRNADSLGVVAVIAIMFGVAFLIMTPLYIQLDYVTNWLDTPMELFLVAIIAGIVFVVTRDYPWTLTLPAIAVVAVVALLAFYIVSPNLFNAIITGQGYLVKSKLYSTISEATAPDFSTLALSFGAVTFWLAIFGVAYAAIRIPKNVTPFYIFLVVWAAVSIYMASAAGRFVFNATPVFAIMAGWILALIISTAQFSEFYKSMVGSRGSFFRNLRKSIKFRHVFVFLVVAGLIILPNAWTALDAAIPNQTKKTYDRQIYDATPDFLKPTTYDTTNGTYWYLGAFSYDLPLPTTYYPAAWSWFSERDANITNPMERPAYLSWWDYGFEAIQAGGHPTVADNFQNGYQMAGSFLMCSNETGAIGLMVTRILEKVRLDNTTDVSRATVALLESYQAQNASGSLYNGFQESEMYHIMTAPGDYIKTILAEPDVYGPYESDLSAQNALYAAARVELSKMGENNLTSLYHDLRGITGYNIGYFAVDSRLFPFSATSQNIFYAPAKLSDQRIDSLSNAPTDYYTITAVDQYGTEYALSDVTSSMTIASYNIHYTALFYKTMLYRAFMGYGPYDIGLTSQGIPGISGSLIYYPPMQGWNMTHFKMVYRTAYYNPYTDYSNHSNDWVAINYTQGQEYKVLIDAGKMNGTVDLSAGGLYSAVVFLQYYDGVTISGTVRSQNGTPMANIYVTALDDNRDPTYYPYGIPHQTVKTDANGNYSIIAPFGNTTIAYSYGTLDNLTQLATVLTTKNYQISYAQAMGATGASGDASGTNINGNITITAASLAGKVYWDLNGDGKFTPGTDTLITNATVILQNKTTGYYESQVSTAAGFSFVGLPPATVTMYAVYQGHTIGNVTVDLNPKNGNITKDLAIVPAQVKGVIMLPSGDVAPNTALQLKDLTTNQVLSTTTSSTGQFAFSQLFSGNYTLSSANAQMNLGVQTYSLFAGEVLNKALTIYSAMTVTGHATNSASPVPYAIVEILNGKRQIWTTADANGAYSITVPQDNYTVYSFATASGVQLVSLASVVGSSSTVTQDLTMVQAGAVSLNVTSAGQTNDVQFVINSKSIAATVYAVSNQSGGVRVLLPAGVYSVYAYQGSSVFWADVTLPGTGVQNITMSNAATLSGKITGFSGGLGNVTVTVADQSGNSVTFYTDSTGAYSIPLVINRNYTLTESLPNYVKNTYTYTNFNTSTVNNNQLVPENRSVSMTLTINGGAPTKQLTVTLTAVGGGAVTATGVTSANGTLTLNVRPGQYSITVDENVTTSSSNRYQLQDGTVSLTVLVGHDPTPLKMPVVERVLVTGNISATGPTKLTFTGPDVRSQNLSAGASYSVYLRTGTYGVYADVNTSSGHSSFFDAATINGPTVLNLTVAPSALVRVQVQYAGQPLNFSTPLTFVSASGAKYTATSGNTGVLNVYMPSGVLIVTADLHAQGTVAGAQRFLRYTNTTTVTIGTSTFSLNLNTVRSLDNTTVTGTMSAVGGAAVGGTISFAPDSAAAIWANYTVASSGAINVQLAPGIYNVYALGNGSAGVFLGKETIANVATQTMNLQLVPEFVYSGTTMVGTTPVQASFVFAGVANVTLPGTASGAFSMRLPAGTYSVKASTTLNEQGLNIRYSLTYPLTLTANKSNDVRVLERGSSRSVSVFWDPSQRATLVANQTAVYNVTVTNTGDLLDTYKLTASAKGWNVSLSQQNVTLQFGGTGVATIKMTITPSSSVLVTQNSITFTASSVNDASVVASTQALATIVPRYAVNATLYQAEPNNGTNYRYQISVNNNGNINDTYLVTVVNKAQLALQGWNVTLTGGNSAGQLNVTVTGLSTKQIELKMVPTVLNPVLNLSVDIMIQSAGSNTTSYNYVFAPELPNVSIPSGGLTATGEKTSSTQQTLPLETTIILAIVMVLLVLLVYLSIKKGVFTRRKR